MRAQGRVGLIALFKKIAQIAAILVTAIGGLALAGWILNIPLLKSMLPGLVTMKTNTAIGFLFGGIATYLLTRENLSRSGLFFEKLCAGIVFGVGLLTFFQYIFHLDLGIDQAIFTEAAHAIGTLSPNRMAPTTAFDFSILGLAMLLLRKSRSRGVVVAQGLVLIAFLPGLLTLMGYAYGDREFLGIAEYTQMALHTAIAVILMSLGIFFSRPEQGLMKLVIDENIGGVVARRMLPFAIIVPFLLGWLRLQGDRLNLYSLPFGVAFIMVAMAIISSGVILGSVVMLNKADACRKKQEEESQYSEARYRGLYENSKDAIMLLVPQKGFIAGNRSTLELFGCKDEKEFIAQGPASLSPEYQPDGSLSSEKVKKMIAICMETGVHFLNGLTSVFTVRPLKPQCSLLGWKSAAKNFYKRRSGILAIAKRSLQSWRKKSRSSSVSIKLRSVGNSR